MTQSGLPVESRPFLSIAKELGVSEQLVIDSFKKMNDSGLIRRIGIVPNHYAIGYTHNLMTVWDIDDKKADSLGKEIGQLEFVSHCYRRPRHLPDWPYNIFAMVHGKTKQEADERMEEIRILLQSDCHQFCALKSSRILKKTGLRL